MQFIANYNTFGIPIKGMSFIWQTHYDNTKNECPKLNPLCKEISLEKQNCKCALTYSICNANIDLNNYNLIVVKFNNEQIKLTPTLLLDYEIIHRLIFSNIEQIGRFGRKLAICVLNPFILGFKLVELIIKSKPLEWSNDEEVYLAQHLIFLKVCSRKDYLFGTEIPWLCEKKNRH